VSSARSNRRLPSITARPTPAEKQRFTALAAARGLSESELALVAIRALLESNTVPTTETAQSSTREPATDRITIRLRPGDRHNINDRAAQRGMKTSAYLAALVRAHIAANPPVPAAELSKLKTMVAVLSALGRVLAQLDRRVTETGEGAPELETSTKLVSLSGPWSSPPPISLALRS
jgi:predicted DNA binding CopG/RHH family protein